MEVSLLNFADSASRGLESMPPQKSAQLHLQARRLVRLPVGLLAGCTAVPHQPAATAELAAQQARLGWLPQSHRHVAVAVGALGAQEPAQQEA